VASGEVTLRASGPGEGGRAQHLALTLARELAGESVKLLVAGSDGHDFTTGAAGAQLDGESWGKAIARGLDPDFRLARFDSATLCRALGAQLPAFDSDTNLADLVLIEKL
jgi:glycerate-2-kinase